MQLYWFSGSNGMFGLTKDVSGSNLPDQHAPWKHLDGIKDAEDILAKADPKKDTALGDVRTQGYHLTKIDIRQIANKD